MIRPIILLAMLGGCLAPFHLGAQAAIQRFGGFSVAPLWPENGDISAYPSQYVFFRPSTNEYVVTYPDTSVEGQKRAMLHVPTHRFVSPLINSTVTRDSDGQYLYSYQISNGATARMPIDSILLVLEQEIAETHGQHDSWSTSVSSDRPAGVNLNAAGILRWSSPAGKEIQAGAMGSTFSIVSSLAPGFAMMSFYGKSDIPELNPLQISRLPAEVQNQLRACKTLGWDTQVRPVIAPRFNSKAPVEAIAANYRYGINALDRRQLLATKSPARAQLNNLLETVAQGAAQLNNSSLEEIKANASEEEKLAISALQLNLKYLSRVSAADIP